MRYSDATAVQRAPPMSEAIAGVGLPTRTSGGSVPTVRPLPGRCGESYRPRAERLSPQPGNSAQER